jgi:uncharacterized protein DUF3179
VTAHPRLLLASFAIVAITLLAACVEDAAAPTPEPLATQLPVFATASDPNATATPVPDLTGTQVTEILRSLVCWYDDSELAGDCLPVGPEQAQLLERIALSRDARFTAPLVDLLWLELGWERWVREALTAITGERFANGYEWSLWLATARPPLPNGYVEWKGRLLSLVDSRYAELLRPDLDLAVRPDELVWARTAPDETPPLVDPDVVHRIEERYLNDDDIVFGVFVDGQARAYPERILAWHELIIDELNERPLLITHCTPCGGAVAYEAAASDGVRYTFGNAGLVYRSRRVLYDRETLSLWDQLTGLPIAGPAITEDLSLIPHTMLRTTWAEWAARHPNTTVLALNTGATRDYDPGIALTEDSITPAPLFPAPVPAAVSGNNTIEAKTLIVGLTVEGESRAYPIALVESFGILHDSLGGQDIALISRGPGLGVTAYREHEITIDYLSGPSDALEAIDLDGERWFLDEEKLVNVIDTRLRRALPLRVSYWFAWKDAYPETTLAGAN